MVVRWSGLPDHLMAVILRVAFQDSGRALAQWLRISLVCRRASISAAFRLPFPAHMYAYQPDLGPSGKARCSQHCSHSFYADSTATIVLRWSGMLPCATVVARLSSGTRFAQA